VVKSADANTVHSFKPDIMVHVLLCKISTTNRGLQYLIAKRDN